LSGASDVERESSELGADFALLGFVAVIFGSSRSEIGDRVSVIEFVGHFSKWDVGVIGFGHVDDGVCVEVEYALLELVKVTV